MTKRISSAKIRAKSSAKHVTRATYPNVDASVVRELLMLLGDYGIDPQPLLQAANIGWSADAISNPMWQQEIPHRAFARFFGGCIGALECVASQREGRLPIRKTEFDMLCYCLISCTTLRAAMERVGIFTEMLHPSMGDHRVEIQGDKVVFVMDSLREAKHEAAYLSDLTGLSSFARLFSWLIGESLEISGVDLCYQPIRTGHILAHLMPHPIRHGAPHNALRFPATYLDRPIKRSPADLDRWLQHFPFDPIEPQSVSSRHVEMVERVLRSALERHMPLPSAKEIAARFGMSVGTLNRRLKDEGSSFSDIKQNCRMERICALLTNPILSISEIAQLTDYADFTALSRAFRNAMGQSPSQWRSGYFAEQHKADA